MTYSAIMSSVRLQHCRGFILAEAMIALVVLGIAFAALEGSSVVVIRALAESDREEIAARLAEAQRERAFGAGCASGAGSDSVNSVIVSWTSVPAAGVLRLSQTSRYPGRFGDHVQVYDAVGACQ